MRFPQGKNLCKLKIEIFHTAPLGFLAFVKNYLSCEIQTILTTWGGGEPKRIFYLEITISTSVYVNQIGMQQLA